MANYPTSLDAFTNPTSVDSLSAPSHSDQHANVNDAIEAIEAKLGIGASTAGSATEGYVLTAGTGGTTTWSAPSIAGLTLIKTQTIGTAVSSVTVTDVFSATYNNYRIIVSNLDASTVTNIRIQFGSTTTGYYGSQLYDSYGGGATGTDRVNNGSSTIVGVTGTDNDTNSSFDVYSPNLTVRSCVAGNFNTGGGYSGWFGGFVDSTTQYTAFNLLVGTGTMTGGKIYVYGYKI